MLIFRVALNELHFLLLTQNQRENEMGFYVNPPDRSSKESFLENEGLEVMTDHEIEWNEVPDGHLPVVLVDNGGFSAAGICYDESELKAFTLPHDTRRKKMYFVPIEKLLKVTGGDFADFCKQKSIS